MKKIKISFVCFFFSFFFNQQKRHLIFRVVGPFNKKKLFFPHKISFVIWLFLMKVYVCTYMYKSTRRNPHNYIHFCTCVFSKAHICGGKVKRERAILTFFLFFFFFFFNSFISGRWQWNFLKQLVTIFLVG